MHRYSTENALLNELRAGTFGDFAAALGRAYEKADLNNRKKLRAIFPEIFQPANDEDVKYTVTEYCSLFYVLAFGADGHGHIEFESEHEKDCAEYIREQKNTTGLKNG